LQFARAGLLETGESLLTAVLSRNTFSKGRVLPAIRTSSISSQKALALGVLALLGERFQKGIIPLRTVLHAIIDPSSKNLDLGGDAVAIPLKASIHAAYQALVEGNKSQPYPFSHEWDREPTFLENEDKLATQVLHSSLNKVSVFRDQYDWLIAKNASELYYPLYYAAEPGVKPELSDIPYPYLALITEIESFFEMLIGLEMNWVDRPEAIYKELYAEMDSTLYYEEALEYQEKVERLAFKLEPYEGKVKAKRIIHETAPVLMALKGILGTMRRRWNEPSTIVSVNTLL
jgi:hypothetical protein